MPKHAGMPLGKWIGAALLLAGLGGEASAQNTVLVEAEGFADKGGWLLDQQFLDVMGSPYLLAHGLGRPVRNASTTVAFPRAGAYHVFVRTRDWVVPHGPGRFRVIVDGTALDTVFGHGGSGKWEWKYGGVADIKGTGAALSLQDMTGYDGRVDAVVFSTDRNVALPADVGAMRAWRNTLLNLPALPKDEGFYDLVVVGGGLAGICASVSAARLGLKVALIQNRPVLGGNSSSEIRVHIMGKYQQQPYPVLGEIVNEIQPKTEAIPENGEEPGRFHDDRKLALVKAEPNITLFLNHHAFAVAKSRTDASRMVSVTTRHVEKNTEHAFRGYLFADCTGDGTIGFLAGAGFMMGRESKADFGEPSAPAARDNVLMGFSNQWVTKPSATPLPVAALPWSLQMPSNRAAFLEGLKTGETGKERVRGEWFWEGGIERDKFAEAEYIRDNNLRAVFGYFHWMRSASAEAAKYAKWDLEWVAHIAGRRESRRLIGDLVLTEQDLVNNVIHPDAAVTSTWTIDLHLPHPTNYLDFGRDAFISVAHHAQSPDYPVPYRCFYTRDVSNLFMAGRNISVTHIALGKTRVMATAGMMGEAVARAAHLARLNVTTPRGVHRNHLQDLIGWFKKPARYAGTYPKLPDSLTTRASAPPLSGAQPGFALAARRGGAGLLAVDFLLPRSLPVRVELGDVSGSRVRLLTEGTLAAGSHSLRIPSRGLPAGVHFVRLSAGGQSAVARVFLEGDL